MCLGLEVDNLKKNKLVLLFSVLVFFFKLYEYRNNRSLSVLNDYFPLYNLSIGLRSN